MIRVLHLCPRTLDFQARRCLEGLLTRLGDEFWSARRMISVEGATGVARAVFYIRRWMRETQADVVHVWSTGALVAATFARAERIVFSPTVPPSTSCLQKLKRIPANRSVQIVLASSAMQRILMARGLDTGRCGVIPPAIDFLPQNSERNAQLRAEIGVADSDFLLLAPGESTRWTGHRLAVWTTALLRELDPRYRLLLWGRGPDADGARNMATALHHNEILIMAEDRLGRVIEAEELATAADAALICSNGPTATLPVGICMAAGLPIVASRAGDLLDDGETALIPNSPTAPMLAKRVIELQDPLLRDKLGRAAREAAHLYFSRQRFIEEWQAVYRDQGQSGTP